MSKRKLSEVDHADSEPPRKTRNIEADSTNQASDAKAKAAARQAKSERRSKKTKDSKSGRRSRPEPRALPDGVDEEQDVIATDPFAAGDESIPLVDDAVPSKSPAKNSASIASKIKGETKAKSKRTKSESNGIDTTRNAAKQHRFILFIGNLPYTTTAESLTHHFRKLQPFTVRHSTEKSNPKKSKGFAFLEFPSYDSMKTCIKLYHHSLFDPDAHLKETEEAATDTAQAGGGKKKKIKKEVEAPPKDTTAQHLKRPTDKTRRINVELTAGGGGAKSSDRRNKIKDKNARLSEQRERAHKKDMEGRIKRGEKIEPTEGARERKGKGRSAATGANAAGLATNGDGGDSTGARGNVHPSRMQRVRG
jgi:nucleolar protein 6